MAHRGVPAAAAVDVLTPGDRVVGAHRAAGIGRLVEGRQDLHRAARVAAEIVPFVGAFPGGGQAFRRRMVGSTIWIVARWICGWLANQVPTSRPYHGHRYSVSLAEWMPTKPPPDRMYRSKAAFSPASRMSPVVLRNTTTLYRASIASLNLAASSVLSTAKPCSAPSASIAAIPCGIKSWRKPVVLEKTSTSNRGSPLSAQGCDPAACREMRREQQTIADPQGSKRRGSWLTALGGDPTLRPAESERRK